MLWQKRERIQTLAPGKDMPWPTYSLYPKPMLINGAFLPQRRPFAVYAPDHCCGSASSERRYSIAGVGRTSISFTST